MEELCKGCIAYCYNVNTKEYYCSHGIKPRYLFNTTIEFCPCISCLIKPMCSRICEEFLNYRSMFNRNKMYKSKRY
jgi:hypothetical protein